MTGSDLGVSNPFAAFTANFGGFLGVPSALSSASSTQLIAAGFHSLLGFTVSEVSGVASQTVTFYDGATSSPSVGGAFFGPVNLGPGQTVTAGNVLPGGWTASSGILTLGVGLNGRGTPSGLVAGAVFYQ
jgi:hypothetical protein